ncbi:MAG TPA: GNAT family N-acetyltransferase [Chitinophagaceae bacterium]
MPTQRDGYRISKSSKDVDLDVVHGFLSTSYWAAGIPREVVARSIANSLCFSLLSGNRQVGFARVVTDQATFAYLADVFIIAEESGKGLGKWLIDEIVRDSRLQGLRRFMLATRDAHELYRKFGFSEMENPDRWMVIHDPDVYKR